MDIKTNFPYGVRSPSEIPDVADRILDEFFQITFHLGIKAAVILGTCLGFYRDGAYLPGDNDLDVVAIVDDEDRSYLCKKLIIAGYLMGRTWPGNTHFVKDGLLLDIFWRKPEGFYAEFGGVPYKGRTAYPIPAKIDEYLTACYGDWRDKQNKIESIYEG
jgi:phosphorylcholine metabolism protein LicD